MVKLLTVEQVAEIFSCAYDKSYNLFRSQGERNNPFKSFRVGRIWYIKESDFEKYINNKVV